MQTETSGSDAGSSAETPSSACGLMHIYNGDEICNARCTKEWGHGGDHYCSNRHSWR